MSIVKIDPEFEALIPKLRPDEYAQLEVIIRREGCRDPLRLWGELLLDGHNRYHICKAHSIPFGTTPIELPDREAARLWIEENQLGRRNLCDDQRAIMLASVMDRRAKASRKAQLADARAKKIGKSSVGDGASTTETAPKKERTRAALAKEHNISERKLKQAKQVSADPEIANKVRQGEMQLAKAAREVSGNKPVPGADRPNELEVMANIVFRPHSNETDARKHLAEFAILIPLEVAELALKASLDCYEGNARATRALLTAWSNVKGYYEDMEADAEKSREYVRSLGVNKAEDLPASEEWVAPKVVMISEAVN